ncbi:MAG: DUF4388 domain-containing protein [Thermoanaerobaculaceae bacterium]
MGAITAQEIEGPKAGTRLGGKIEDVTLPGLLQMLAVRRRTGKLTLTSRENVGLVVVRDGHIIYAATNSAREALGNILVCQQVIDEATLTRALELQHESSEEKRLGAVLVEMGAVSPAAIEEVMRQQTTLVMREMFAWEKGFFAFDPVELPEGGEVAVDTRDLVMESGLNAGDLVRDSLDAGGFETQPVRFQRSAGAEASPDRHEKHEGGPTLASLKSIMTELRSPAFGGEITLWLLRYAGTVVRRRVLFSISKEGIRGMGQAGLDGVEGTSDRLRRVRIPVDEPSVFKRVVEVKTSFVGRLSDETWDRYLVEQLGGVAPTEVAIVPMVVNGQAVALLYGDNLPDGGRIGPIEGLELLMLEAGLAMEKTALEVRLRTLKERLGSR